MENETNNSAEEQTENPDVENSAPAEKKEEVKTFTQDEVNEIVKERLAREKSRYSDYEDLKKTAQSVDEIRAESESFKSRAEEAEIQLLRHSVASDKGVPAHLLKASTQEELEAEADALNEFRGNRPVSNSFEKANSSKSKGNSSEQFASVVEDLFSR